MSEGQSSKTDTGRLRAIAREEIRSVLHDELNIEQAVEAAIQKCIADGNIATTAQVEAMIVQKTQPLETRVKEADDRLTTASEAMLRHANRFASQVDTLSLSEARFDGSIKRIDANERRVQALETLTYETRQRTEVNAQKQKELRADIYGDNLMPDDQSLVGMLRSQHTQLNASYQEIMAFLTKIDARVQQHDTFILNRKKIENAVKGAFSFGWGWIKDNRWKTALGGAITAGIAALVRVYSEHTPEEWELLINSILMENHR